MDPDYLPRLIELMRANGFAEADIVDVTSRLVGPPPTDLVIQREVIATAVLAGLATQPMPNLPAVDVIDIDVNLAVNYADALIARLLK